MRSPLKRFLLAAECSVILLGGVFFASCSKTDDGMSFTKTMDTVDAFIKTGSVNDAVKLLKKAEKDAYSSYARLGIYKRYLVLGEETLAEKTLVKALKKLPDNPEITAVYGNLLLKKGDYNSALKTTEKLAGTKYGSIYSEALVTSLLNDGTDIKNNSALFTKEISPAYYDIYAGTDDERWLRNCALIYLMNGDYTMASRLQPEEISDSESGLFWGYVQYDAGNYDVAVRNLSHVKNDLLSGVASSLMSDSYAMLDDEDSAEEVRSSYIEKAGNFVKISPSLLVNSGLWAYRHEEYKRAYDYIVAVATEYPDYIPALISYGKLAWEDSRGIVMSEIEKSLRKTSLRSGKMRMYDERPKFSIDDAIFRMEEQLKKEEAEGGIKSDELVVERLSLYLKTNDDLSLTKKTAAIWAELEKNEAGTNLYPPHLVQFSVQKLLSFGLTEEARNLFTNYAIEKFGLNKDDGKPGEIKEIKTDIFGGRKIIRQEEIPASIARLAFGDKAALAADKMDIWEVEYAAYFALLDKNITAAERLYEYVNFETGGKKLDNADGNFVSVSNFAASSSSANLAMIYSSKGDYKRAVNLYTLAAGKTPSKKTKSKLLCRIARLQYGMGKSQDARLSASYSVNLDPSNADARLLLKTISEK